MRHGVQRICFISGITLPMLFTVSALAAKKSLDLREGQRYLVFDPRLHGQGKRCELKLHSFRRHPLNPIVKPERPWEATRETAGAYRRNKGRIQVDTVLWEP